MIDIKKNEATATYRRMYFHCVDVTDGMTPETGEAGGQPQVSVNGDAFGTQAIIGVLVAIGNGRYYAELTQAGVNIADRSVIEGRYKSANTAEAVGTTVQIREFPIDISVSTLALEAGGNLASTLADTNELQGLISSSKLPAQVKGIDDIDFGATMKASVRTQVDEANTAYGANKIAPNVVIPDVAGTVAGLLNTKIPTALTFTGSDVKATLDGEEVTPTVASKTGYALSVAGILAIWNQLTTDVGIIAGSFAKKLADWVILTSQSIRDAMKLAPTAGDPDVGSVDKHLDDILTNTALTGASHITLTFLKTATTIPLEGVSVTVRNSTDTMTKGIVETDANGITEFNIDDDTYILRPTMVGYLFDSITLIVSGDTEETYYGDARIPTPAPDPDIQTLTMTIRDLSGNPVINCLVQAVPTKRQIVNDTVIGLLKMTETTNTNGYAELFVEKLSEISVTAGADGEHLDMTITVTSDDDRDISDYV
jgi:hypothetical protein